MSFHLVNSGRFHAEDYRMMGDRSEDNNRSTRGYELMVNESGGLKRISSGAKMYVSEASCIFVHDFWIRKLYQKI